MLCTTIKRENFKEIYEAATKYPFVELRLDDVKLTKDEIIELVKIPNVKKIVTIRNISKPDDQKLKELIIAAENGCDFVDVEYQYVYAEEFCKATLWQANQTILSYHNFEKLPEPTFFKEVANKAEAASAEYLKIACYCKTKADFLNLLKIYKNPRLSNFIPGKIIALPIGERWELHRFALLQYGAPFLYVCEDDFPAVAPGQVPYSIARKALKMED